MITLLVAELHSEYVLIHIHVLSVVNVRRTTHTASGKLAPQTKKLSESCAGDKICMKAEPSNSPDGHRHPKSYVFTCLSASSWKTDLVAFAWTATSLFYFDFCTVFPSYRTIRTCKRSAFTRPDRRFAMLRSLTN